MKRDLSPEELRDEQIDKLASECNARLRGQLVAGNRDVASAIGEAISVHMTDEIQDEQIAYAVMPNGGRASPRFQKLVEKALADMAEVEAIKEVERMEKDRKQQDAEARAELAMNQ